MKKLFSIFFALAMLLITANVSLMAADYEYHMTQMGFSTKESKAVSGTTYGVVDLQFSTGSLPVVRLYMTTKVIESVRYGWSNYNWNGGTTWGPVYGTYNSLYTGTSYFSNSVVGKIVCNSTYKSGLWLSASEVYTFTSVTAYFIKSDSNDDGPYFRLDGILSNGKTISCTSGPITGDAELDEDNSDYSYPTMSDCKFVYSNDGMVTLTGFDDSYTQSIYVNSQYRDHYSGDHITLQFHVASGQKYLHTGSYNINTTKAAGTVYATTGNKGSFISSYYYHPSGYDSYTMIFLKSGSVKVINPNHTTEPLYVYVNGKQSQNYNVIVPFGTQPSKYSVTVSTSAGANGSASITSAEGYGYTNATWDNFSTGGNYYYAGTNITLVAPEAAPGYTWKGWSKTLNGNTISGYSSQSKAITVGNTNNTNGTFYANYTANTYNVVFNGNGNTGGAMSNQSHTYGSSKALTTNAFTRTGYTFIGWATSADRANAGTVDYTDGQSVSNLTTTNNGTYNLYAVWEMNETVTFTIASYSNGTVTVTPNDGSGAFTSGSRDLAVGTVVSFSAVANTNYHISTVNLNIKGSDNSFSTTSAYTLKTEDGTVTLTANFLPDTYAITYNKGENGTGADIAAGEKTYNVNFTLSSSTFTREGYTQTGWSTEDGGSKAYELGATYTDNTALTLYPYWEVNSYTLTWTTDGDALTGTYTSGTVDYGTAIVPPNTPTKTGYTFAAWSPTPAATMPAAPTTYTATWDATEYTITYHDNGGYGSINTVYTIEEDVDLPTAEDMTKTGYNFIGWYDNAELTGDAVTAIAAGTTGNKEYWAKWELGATPEIDLSDDSESSVYTDMLSTYSGLDINVTLTGRTLVANQWNTLCLPFTLETLEGTALDGRVYEMSNVTVDNVSGMVITFAATDVMTAGKPYLVWVDAAIAEPRFEGVQLTTFTPQTVNAPSGDVEFRGTMQDGYLTEKSSVFISSNRLYYAKQSGSGTRIRAFRAYFEVTSYGSNPLWVGPRMRIVADGQTATAVIEAEEEAATEVRKYVENGVLVIERNGVKYNAAGGVIEN